MDRVEKHVQTFGSGRLRRALLRVIFSNRSHVDSPPKSLFLWFSEKEPEFARPATNDYQAKVHESFRPERYNSDNPYNRALTRTLDEGTSVISLAHFS
jgi:hypothetical protein